MFVARIINRRLATLYNNPIIRYLNSNDYRIAIAAYKEDENSTTSNAPRAGDFLAELIPIVNNATDTEKTEFLQHAESQQKLFEIIGGLFLYLSYGCCNVLPFHYINDLLEMLALDPELESRFAHSISFINSAHLLPIYNYPHSLALHNLCFAIIQRYPDIELKSLSRRNIQKELSDKSIHCIETKTNLLVLLKRIPHYLEGKLTNEEIIAFVPGISLISRHGRRFNGKDLIHYASVLVTFIEEPNQLLSHFSDRNPSATHAIEKVIVIEEKLRNESLSPGLFLNGSHDLKFYMSSEEKYQHLLESLMPAVDHVQKWLPTRFFSGHCSDLPNMIRHNFQGSVIQPDARVQYGLYRYLKQDTSKTAYKSLLDLGFSPDMVVRIALHDMLRPEKLALSKQIINNETVSVGRPNNPSF